MFCCLPLIWPWASSEVIKRQTKLNIELICTFNVENILVKLQQNSCNSWRDITFRRPFDGELDWKFKKVAQCQHQTFPKCLCRKHLVKLQHDIGNFWWLIVLTRWCHLPLIWPRFRLKVHEGQININIKIMRFWCEEHPCKVITWWMQLLRHYHIHKAAWPHRTHPRFWCGEYLCKIAKWYRQFLQSYRVHKAAWPWASLKVQKGHTKINVELVRDIYVENTHVKIQHDTGNLQKVIAFTRFRTLPAARPGNDNTLQPKGAEGQKVKHEWLSVSNLDKGDEITPGFIMSGTDRFKYGISHLYMDIHLPALSILFLFGTFLENSRLYVQLQYKNVSWYMPLPFFLQGSITMSLLF